MTGSSIQVVVTLPATTVAEVREELPPCVEAGADVAEVRFDRWSEGARTEIAELFPSSIPLLATYRSMSEGGSGADEPGSRQRTLEKLAAFPFDFLDLERRRDTAMIERLSDRETRPRLVLSTHLGPSWTLSEVRQTLQRSRGHPAMVKVVVPASVTTLYASLRGLLPFRPGGGPRVLLTTDGSGPVLRALARRLGLAAVFAAPPSTLRERPRRPPVEPSQIPLDALVPFLRPPTGGPLFAVLGHPVSHSLSPPMHNGWHRRQRRTALFVPIDIRPTEEFRHCVNLLGEDGFLGFNVTHPWKREALACASNASDIATRAGCANTLTRSGSAWSADNFDVAALVRRGKELREEGRWRGEDLLVLGTGGAARAAIVAARELGVTARIRARSPSRAAELARSLDAQVAGAHDRPASLIVHATTTGMRGNPNPLAFDWTHQLDERSYVLDMVYRPEYGDIRTAAERRGAQYEDGSRILVYQAAECHRRWWGEPPGSALEGWALSEVLCAG